MDGWFLSIIGLLIRASPSSRIVLKKIVQVLHSVVFPVGCWSLLHVLTRLHNDFCKESSVIVKNIFDSICMWTKTSYFCESCIFKICWFQYNFDCPYHQNLSIQAVVNDLSSPKDRVSPLVSCEMSTLKPFIFRDTENGDISQNWEVENEKQDFIVIGKNEQNAQKWTKCNKNI